MRQLLDRLRILQDETFCLSNQTLAGFRIVYFFFALTVRTPSSLRWADDYPDWLRNPPPGLSSLIGVPPLPILTAIQWAAIAFAAMGLVGYRTRLAAVGYTTLMVVHHSIEFSFGKIDHDLLWLVLPLVLASSGWGRAYALDTARGQSMERRDWALRNSRAVALLYTIFAVAFSTAAAAKFAGWLDPTFSTAADWVRYYRVSQADEAILAEAVLRLPPIVWEAIDYGTIAIELAPLAFLFVPPAARRVVFSLVLFHLGVLLTMGIDFGLYLIVYIPLAAHPFAGARFDQMARRWSPAVWVTIGATASAAWKLGVAPVIESLGGQGAFGYVPALLMFLLTASMLVLFSLPPRPIRRVDVEEEPTPVGTAHHR